jgi:hypothetical protein
MSAYAAHLKGDGVHEVLSGMLNILAGHWNQAAAVAI